MPPYFTQNTINILYQVINKQIFFPFFFLKKKTLYNIIVPQNETFY